MFSYIGYDKCYVYFLGFREKWVPRGTPLSAGHILKYLDQPPN